MNIQIKQIAERLRALRESLELTQEKAAEKCGVPTEEYQQYESGEYDIPMSFICQAADTFGIDTTALLVG
ncbi:MAG: helix-turn-helix transcriptional regulator, partial [Paludibacteraceae bacterium]|nr:helix-turn-helix transcriptional regulator [Paludibacteraceae bacterium]